MCFCESHEMGLWVFARVSPVKSRIATRQPSFVHPHLLPILLIDHYQLQSHKHIKPKRPHCPRSTSNTIAHMGFTNKLTRHYCVSKNRKTIDKATGQIISGSNYHPAYTLSIPKGRYCVKHKTYCPVHTARSSCATRRAASARALKLTQVLKLLMVGRSKHI
jgi:hypothetical protein